MLSFRHFLAKNKMAYTFIFLQLAFFLPGKDIGAQQSTGSLLGYAFCSDSGAPARIAIVTLESVPDKSAEKTTRPSPSRALNPTATTDMQGRFRIDKIPPGLYYVIPYLSGYLSPASSLKHSGGIDSNQATETIDATIVTIQGGRTASTSIRIERSSSIAGSVTYDDGSPAIGFNVKVFRVNSDGTYTEVITKLGGPSGIFASPNSTDSHGKYIVEGLPAGNYIVRVATPSVTTAGMSSLSSGSSAFSLKQELGNQLSVYSGGAFREKYARKIELKQGEENQSVDIVIPLSNLFTIKGYAVDAADNSTPLGSGVVQLLNQDDRSVLYFTSLHPDGSFVFNNVPRGGYVVYLPYATLASVEQAQNGSAQQGQMYGPAEKGIQLEGNIEDISIAMPAK